MIKDLRITEPVPTRAKYAGPYRTIEFFSEVNIG